MLNIDDKIEPYGRIKAIGFIGGERYYWLIDKSATVSMLPASFLEKFTSKKEKK
jgi:hypothetical protein